MDEFGSIENVYIHARNILMQNKNMKYTNKIKETIDIYMMGLIKGMNDKYTSYTVREGFYSYVTTISTDLGNALSLSGKYLYEYTYCLMTGDLDSNSSIKEGLITRLRYRFKRF